MNRAFFPNPLRIRRPMPALFFLGLASGLPLMLVFGTLSAWLTDENISKAAIGLFALVKTPYTFKFLWSPFLDRYGCPGLGKWLGHRRGWALLWQALLVGALIALAGSNPALTPWLTAALAVLVAFCSASQDIVLDAYRVEILEPQHQAQGTAVFVTGARIGTLLSGGGALWLADSVSWPTVYIVMAGFMGIGMLTVLFSKEPQRPAITTASGTSLRTWFQQVIIAPFADFLNHPRWWYLLAVVLLYKLGEAFLGVMAMPFYLETGFSKTEIAAVSKFYGTGATIIGGLLGGYLSKYLGLFRLLVLGAILQSLSNLGFMLQAYAGADTAVLTLVITLDNISGGLGTTAFLAFFASLCNKAYTGTQFALLTSLMAFSRDLLASTSGIAAEWLAWPEFFIVSALLGVPGLVMVVVMRKEIQVYGTRQQNNQPGGTTGQPPVS